MAYPRSQRARGFKFLSLTGAGTLITMNGTSWANMPTIGTIALAAQVGDVFEVGFGGYYATGATNAFLDAVSEVSSSPVNSFANATTALTSTTGAGVGSWFCKSSVDFTIGGSVLYTVVAGDLSSGTVTIRMRCRTGSAVAKILDGSGGSTVFFAKNLGPVSPH